MKNNKILKQRMIILVVSVVWLVVLSLLYSRLPDVIPIQFNLQGEVGNSVSKVFFFILVSVFYGGYLLYSWIRFKDKLIPNKQLITIYFLMFFSIFILVFGLIIQ
jgi:hypothetical protein